MYSPYQPQSIPPEILLMMMAEKEKQAQAQNQGGAGLAKPAAGAGAAGAGASYLGGTSAATAAGQTAGTAGVNIANAGAGVGLKGSAAASQAAPTMAGNLAGMGALPALGILAGTALTAKGVNDAIKGREDNSNTGKAARAQSAVSTFGFSELGRGLGIGGGKGKDQQGRDANRAVGREKGVYDDNYNYTRLDGVTKNMGMDGSKGSYNVDFNDKSAVDLISYLDPLSEVIAGGDAKRRSDQTGEFVNALKDAKDPMAEIRNLYQKYQVGADQFSNFKTEDNRGDVYRAKVGEVLGGQPSIPKAPSNSVTSPMGGIASKLPAGIEKPINIMPQVNKSPFETIGQNKPMLVDPGFNASTSSWNIKPQPMIPTRSSTSSPGIGKDGRRINYGK